MWCDSQSYSVDSVIDRDTCDDPHVCKNLQKYPWMWHKIQELIVLLIQMFWSKFSQKYSQSLTGESQDNILKLVLKIYSEVNYLV